MSLPPVKGMLTDPSGLRSVPLTPVLVHVPTTQGSTPPAALTDGEGEGDGEGRRVVVVAALDEVVACVVVVTAEPPPQAASTQMGAAMYSRRQVDFIASP